MKGELLQDAIGMIGDDLIEAVDTLRQRKRPRRHVARWASLAACICFVAGGVFLWSRGTLPESELTGDNHPNHEGVTESFPIEESTPDITESAYGVSIPKLIVAPTTEGAGDMVNFFIYLGRAYVLSELIVDADNAANLTGEYLAHVDDSIDEWTATDDYIELSGSVSGEIYTASGYDPEFMLCLKHDTNGSIGVYMNTNGITLTKGAELFEDRLQLTGNFTAIEYQTHEDWYNGRKLCVVIETATLLPETESTAESARESVVDRFLAALNDGDFVYTANVPLSDGETSIYDRELYHLYFRMENGMTTHLRLYEGGYVSLDSLPSVCVRMNEDAFHDMINQLKLKKG